MKVIRAKRIYDQPAHADGFRVLVDRLWPRGVKKAEAHIDLWAKNIAPTPALRAWFGHEASKLVEFRTRYLRELRQNRKAAVQLLAASDRRALTLLFAARDSDCNHAIILREFLIGLSR